MDLTNKQFFTLCIVCIGLYYISFWIGDYFRKKRIIKQKPTKDYIAKVIRSINKMNGSQFEDFVGFVFREAGYKVYQTKKTRDGGKDLILKTDKGKMYVEIKRYASRNLVSSSHVLKLIGSAVSDGVKQCLFVTTSGYTKDAIELAESSKVDVKLIDLNGFEDILKACNFNRVLRYLGY